MPSGNLGSYELWLLTLVLLDDRTKVNVALIGAGTRRVMQVETDECDASADVHGSMQDLHIVPSRGDRTRGKWRSPL